jgi:carbon monoxide dehydrogenase subunit G
MKYITEIIIEVPIDKVIELFDNPENMKEWQPGLISFETYEGEAGKPGAKSRLIYQMGKRTVEMIETIEVRKLPQEFSGTYEVKNVWNRVRNFFEAMDGQKTKYITEHEFRFSGFMKLMAFFMPMAFKKQSLKYMKLFKEFAERSS